MSNYNPKDSNLNSPVPDTEYSIALISLQEHTTKRGKHVDLRIAFPMSNIAHSWAIPKGRLPSPGEKLLATESGDHSIESMRFKGKIPEGYGAGIVNLLFYDKAEVLESSSNEITFNMYKGSEVQRYKMFRYAGKGWIIYNTTPTKKTRPEIPQHKRSYSEVKMDEIDYHDPNKVLAEKIDGAHVIIALRPESRVDVFSYRPSKKMPAFIDHSQKTDLYKLRSPRSLGKTILRAELFVVDPRTKRPLQSTETGGILNAGTWKSRESQATKGKLEHLIYDIDVYKGKNVADYPYEKKFELLNEVKHQFPNLNIVQPVGGVVQKRNLVDEVVSGKNCLSHEGVVIYDLTKSVPEKAKITRDIDVYFQQPFAPAPGSRLERMGAIGGFCASRDPGGIANIRVGSGLSDELRKDIAKNPEKYKNLVAKIYAQEELKSGKLRMPIFKEFRTYEQWPSKSASKILGRDIERLQNLFSDFPSIMFKRLKKLEGKKLTDYGVRKTQQRERFEKKLESLLTKKSSVLDPVQLTLDPELWDKNQKLHPNIRLTILQNIKNVLGPETNKISTVKLLGASATMNWTPSTDIDVNVGFYPFEDPNILNIYSDMLKQANPHPLSGSKHVINLFAVLDSGEKQTEFYNILALYDVLNNTWLKKPDPKGSDISWLLEYEKSYINIYQKAIIRAVEDLKLAIANKRPYDEIRRKTLKVVRLYKYLDKDRKLSYAVGAGIPNIGEANIVYKSIMKSPHGEVSEKLYKLLKPSLLKGG